MHSTLTCAIPHPSVFPQPTSISCMPHAHFSICAALYASFDQYGTSGAPTHILPLLHAFPNHAVPLGHPHLLFPTHAILLCTTPELHGTQLAQHCPMHSLCTPNLLNPCSTSCAPPCTILDLYPPHSVAHSPIQQSHLPSGFGLLAGFPANFLPVSLPQAK